MTKVKLIKAPSLDSLETAVNEWMDDVEHGEHPKYIVVYNVQQFTIGEVVQGITTMTGQAPAVKYSFCLLIFYSSSIRLGV